MEILIILTITGVICALIAHGKGRSPIGWFFIGFIAPLLGIILVFVLPDQKEVERRFNRLGKQNRLLRERLRQSKTATRKRLAGVNRRLTAHDRSLDMDTDAGQQDQGPLPYTDDEEEAASAAEPQPSRATPIASPLREPQRQVPAGIPARPGTVRVVPPGTTRVAQPGTARVAGERNTTEVAPSAQPVRPVPRRRPS